MSLYVTIYPKDCTLTFAIDTNESTQSLLLDQGVDRATLRTATLKDPGAARAVLQTALLTDLEVVRADL